MSLPVRAEVAITAANGTPSFSFAQGIDYLVETAKLSPQQAATNASWQTMTRKGINLHHEHNPVWFRFEVVVPAGVTTDWLLEVAWPPLDLIELHIFDHERQQWLPAKLGGNSVNLERRALLHRDYLFPLSLPSEGHYSLYLRMSSLSHFVVPLQLWQASAFFDYDQKLLLLQGILVGILGVMLLYNSSLYIFTRDKSYFFYSAYVFSILFFVLALTGLGAQHIWGDNDWLRRRSFLISASFSYLTATLFVRQFLSLERYGGWLLRVNNIIGIFWAYAFITPFVPDILPQRPLLLVADLAGALSGLAGIVTTVYLWRRGDVSAKYFTIAWGLLIVSNMMFALMLEGVLDRNPFTVYSLQVGFVIEVVLLSLVLAERINRERAAREEAQIEALQLSQQFSDEREAKLAIQAEALAMQRAANEELELRVRERTKDLESAMQAVERFNRELKELSNRRYFEKTFADELSQAHRHQHPLSVVVLDLDHFKQINDVHGHLAGDECLKLVAGVLRQRVARPRDLVARYGGEEFVILLPAASQEDAIVVADQLRQTIEKLDFIAAGQHVSLSASFGVAGWIPAQGERYEKLIAAADAALYQAKSRGRNCTVAAAG
jgi:diguanylate cyclase